MAEYVTLIEAAELEGVKYKTMAQRLSRNPDKFDTMTEKSENGGKDAVLVAVASLSKKARNAWKERAKLKELSGTISPEGEAQPEPEAPWYVEADVDWYIENYREQWYKGSRDTSGLKVMQIVMGDEHTFDCWVAYKQPNGKVIPIKPHLAAWVDMRSRAIMGDVLCKDGRKRGTIV